MKIYFLDYFTIHALEGVNNNIFLYKLLSPKYLVVMPRTVIMMRLGPILGYLMISQIANIHWIIKKAREFLKNIYFCFIDYTQSF